MSGALDVVGMFREAFVGSLLVALACGLLGVHVVARRMIAAGLALPQVGALGIALGLLLCTHLDEHASHAVEGPLPHLVALGAVLGSAALLAWPSAQRAVGQPALAGMLFAGSGALTILVMAHSAQGMEEVHHLVEGNVLAIGRLDLLRLAGGLVPVVLLLTLGARRLVFCTFDREMAATLGIRVRLWDAALYAAFAVTAAIAVHAAGTLFVFSFLVLPGAAGVLLGRSGAAALVAAALVASLAAAAGFVASASALDTPTGPTCAAAAIVLFLGAAAVARVRRHAAPR